MREGWKRVRLNEFVWFQRGFDLPKAKFENGEVPVYGSTSVLGYHNIAKVKAPGIITGRSGTLGVMQFTKEDFWPHNTTLWVKDFKGNDERFAYYLLKCLDFGLFNSGGAVPTLNRNVLNSLVIDLPPLKTQRKIANILSAYDDLIENNLKRIKLLEELAQQTYEEWFVRFKFPGYEDVEIDEESGLPVGWEKIKLEKIISFRVDNRGRNPKHYFDKGIPVLDNHLITNSPYVNLNKAKRFLDDELFDNFLRKYLEPNDVLITLVGTVGSLALAPKEKCAIIQNTIGLRCNSLCNPYFLFLFLKYNKQAIINNNRGSAQPSVKVGDLLSIKMNLPNSNLLDEFKKNCKPIFDQVNNLGNQNQHLKEARDILLPRLMSGMIDVDQLEVGSLEYDINDGLGMVAEIGSVYEKDKVAINSLFNTINYDYEIAVVVLLTRQILNRDYGKKYIHKMFSNIKFLEALPVFKDLEFQEKHWGMYCPVLEKTINSQKYIRFDDIGNERSVLNFNYKFIKEVTNWMNEDDYARDFVSQVKNMLSIYQKSLIDKGMDRIELLNTVLECMNVLETNNFDAIWHKMENWTMKEEGYRTKAEKFKPRETELMIELIKGLK